LLSSNHRTQVMKIHISFVVVVFALYIGLSTLLIRPDLWKRNFSMFSELVHANLNKYQKSCGQVIARASIHTMKIIPIASRLERRFFEYVNGRVTAKYLQLN
jgi:hypothetical protein